MNTMLCTRKALCGLLAAVCVAAAQPAHAQDAPPAVNQRLAAMDSVPQQAAPPGLAALLRDAFANSPRMAAARALWQAAVEEYPQARALPNPSLNFTWFPEPVETRLGPNTAQIRVGQMFPAPGKLSLKGDMAAARAELSRVQYEIAVRDVVTDVRISYAELQYLQRALEISQQNKDLVERLLAQVQKDYGADAASLNDVLRVQAQLAQVSYDLLLIEELRQTEITHMNALLNRAPQTPVAVAPLQSFTIPQLELENLYAVAELNRQEIRLADIREQMGGIGLGLARKISSPDYNVGLVYNTIGSAMNPNTAGSGRDAWGISVGMTLPIWSAHNRAALRGAEHARAAAQSGREQALNDAREKISNIYFKIRTSSRLVDLYETTLAPQARQSLEQSDTWYNAGQATAAELIEVQAVWLNFELALARARADLEQNIARLEQAAGAPLNIRGGGAQ